MDKITGDAFKGEVLEAETPVLVDFFATWCGPCRMLDPVLKDLASGFEGKVKFVKVDIDEAQSVAEQYAVSSVPTLMLFKGGEVEDKKIGASPKPVLEKWLGGHVA